MADISDSLARIDIHGITEFLQETFPLLKIHSVRNGPKSYSNRLWLADTSDGDLLIRIPGRTEDSDSVRACMVATDLAKAAGIPTVQYVYFTPHSRWGLPILIQEFSPGENATTVLKNNDKDIAKFAHALGDWIGELHSIRGSAFGSVLTNGQWPTFTDALNEQVDKILSEISEDILPSSKTKIEMTFHRILERLTDTDAASLIHGDIYFDNVLIHEGIPKVLLDFEHATFHNRFIDFGKIEELLFEWWPTSRQPFFESYRSHFSAHQDDELYFMLSRGFYALNQTRYFARWQPELVPEYRERLHNWTKGV